MEWLALAGALDALCPARRQALWSLPAIHHPRKGGPQLRRQAREAAGSQETFTDLPIPPLLPDIPDFPFKARFWRQWEALGFSPDGHTIRFWRKRLTAKGVLPCAALQQATDK